MESGIHERPEALAFDIFGTVLDLAGSLTPRLSELLDECGAKAKATTVWPYWRLRQRIEQYQDNLLMLGHSGYLAVMRRSLLYTLRTFKVTFSESQIDDFMLAYQELEPFEDAVTGLERLAGSFRLVMLSNGEHDYLAHLSRNRIRIPFNEIVSVESVGQFKPHPAVYRFTAQKLNLAPGRIMMVAAHSFDILGARASGYRGAYIDRYDLPYDESPLQPDLTVEDFNGLCDWFGV
jgi:2-haloacid dehalogenase